LALTSFFHIFQYNKASHTSDQEAYYSLGEIQLSDNLLISKVTIWGLQGSEDILCSLFLVNCWNSDVYFVIYLTAPPVSQLPMLGLVNIELETVWKEAVIA
jgi:hypothetical protein